MAPEVNNEANNVGFTVAFCRVDALPASSSMVAPLVPPAAVEVPDVYEPSGARSS